MLSLRAFMFERVYLGPQAAPEHAKAHEVVRRIFDHLVERGDDADEIVDYIAGMTDRFALAYAESLWGCQARGRRRSTALDVATSLSTSQPALRGTVTTVVRASRLSDRRDARR